MELLEFKPVTAPAILAPDQREVILVPIGDIQAGAAGCQLDLLDKHIKRWNKKKNVCYIGMGDYVDVMSPSNRDKWLSVQAGMYETPKAAMDFGVANFQQQVENILAPTKGKWVGLLTGHHNYPYQDGTTVDTRLAEFLKAPYLGHSTLAHMQFRSKDNKRNVTFKLYAHHGQGMGTTLEASIRTLRNRVVPYWFAHVYLIGHYHQVVSASVPWINTRVKSTGEIVWESVDRKLVTTGSYLTGHTANSKDATGMAAGAYPEEKLLPPNVLGGPVLFLRPDLNASYPTVNVEVLT